MPRFALLAVGALWLDPAPTVPEPDVVAAGPLPLLPQPKSPTQIQAATTIRARRPLTAIREFPIVFISSFQKKH